MRRNILAACLTISLFALLYVGSFLENPQSSPIHSDLIVILGGGLGERAITGSELYKKNYADTLLITGIDEELARKSPTEDPFFRLDYLLRQGIPSESIIIDNTASSTWEEAILIRHLSEGNHFRSILIITDAPHIRRLDWTLSHVLHGTSIRWHLVAAQSDWWHPYYWWNNERSSKFVFQEILKLCYYTIRYCLQSDV